MNNQAIIFDHPQYVQRQKKCSRTHLLYQKLGAYVIDRLKDFTYHFEKILVVGACSFELYCFLKQHYRGTIEIHTYQTPSFECDYYLIREENIAFQSGAYDLIICDHFLHHVNYLPEFLTLLHHHLKADGVLLATAYGPATLQELKRAFLEAECDLKRPVRPHISPFLNLEKMGALFREIGFQMPVVDTSSHKVLYASLDDLFQDLRAIGETNYLTSRGRGLMGKQVLARAKAYYQAHFLEDDNKYKVTVELLDLCGWRYHEKQQSPLRRGSAELSMGTIFNQEHLD